MKGINHYTGKLNIKVIQARLYRNTEIFGAMDPFIVVEYRKIKYRTKTARNAGASPNWNETVEIPMSEWLLEDELFISCFDEDLMLDDIIANAYFKISYLLGKNGWVSLNFEGKKAADLHIETKFVQNLIPNTPLMGINLENTNCGKIP